jgi:hypothetical protein
MLIPPIRDPTQERDNVLLDFLNISFSRKVGAGGFGTPCGVTQGLYRGAVIFQVGDSGRILSWNCNCHASGDWQ